MASDNYFWIIMGVKQDDDDSILKVERLQTFIESKPENFPEAERQIPELHNGLEVIQSRVLYKEEIDIVYHFLPKKVKEVEFDRIFSTLDREVSSERTASLNQA